MRQAPNQKRPRGGRSTGRRSGGHGGNRTYESSGPASKIRGNASQLFSKYQAMARDAHTSGDRVAAENYMQHAEHYYRLLNQSSAPQQQQQRGQGHNSQDGTEDGAQRGQPAPDAQGAQEAPVNASRSASADNGGQKQPDIEPVEVDDGEPETTA
jgi:hypothetical protein